MKCIILLGIIALCYSLPFQSRHVDISENGTITITEPTGKKIIISKNTDTNGKKNIDISITGSNTINKKIIIDEANHIKTAQIGSNEYEYTSRDKRSNKKQTQDEILFEIFKDYQGLVDEKAYEKLLKKVGQAVDNGEVNPIIYAILNGTQNLEIYPTKLGEDFVVEPMEQKHHEVETYKPYPIGAQKPHDISVPFSYTGGYGKTLPVQYHVTNSVGYPDTYLQSRFVYQQQPFKHYTYSPYSQFPYYQEHIPLEVGDYEREFLIPRILNQQQKYSPSYSSYHGYPHNPYQEYLLRNELEHIYSTPIQSRTGYTGLQHPYAHSTTVVY